MANCKSRWGTVASVGSEGLAIRLDPEEPEGGDGCNSCKMRGMCHGRTKMPMEATVWVDDPAGRVAGDRVRLAYRQANPALAASLLFVPALAGVFFGGFVGNFLFGEGDGVFLAGSGCGLIFGLIITYAMNRTFPSLRPQVTLLEANQEEKAEDGVF